jgi:NADPH:quinone reductase-like Zn-dependent oxidoreductase
MEHFTQDGTWREYVDVAAEHLIPIPDGLTDDDVANVSTGASYLTAYLALTDNPSPDRRSALRPRRARPRGHGMS